MRRSALCIFIFMMSFPAIAQRNVTLRASASDSGNKESESIINTVFSDQTFRDSVSCLRYLELGLNKLRSSGYLTSSIDSVNWSGDTIHAVIYTGALYQWASLTKGNAEPVFLQGSGFRDRGVAGEHYNAKQINSLLEKIVSNCENNGYPFASARLDSVRMMEDRLYASLRLDKGRFTVIDSILVKGSNPVAPVYLYNYLGVKPGDPYNEQNVSRIEDRLRELPFVRQIRPSSVLFTEKYTRLDLFLEPKKASQFDGVIGLLPDETGTGKLNLTGEVHLKLQNSFKRGEVIEVNWKQLPPRSQDLKVHLLYPFLFNTPFGIDGFLNLYRRDTLFVDVIKNLGVLVTMKGNNFAKGFVNDKQSTLQSTAGLENITTLPAYADVSATSYGITLHFEELDYRFNPRKGYLLDFTGSAGTRTIDENPGVNPAVYENLDLKTTQYQGEVRFAFFAPIAGKHVAMAATRSAYIYNTNIFENELYRIGGLNSLRGFDEESIFASSYSILNLEYRYLTDQNSFLFGFVNGAWYERKSTADYINDTPFGFGAGINFETRIGIMSVSYALGKQFDNPIQVKNGKVHFGIVNYF